MSTSKPYIWTGQDIDTMDAVDTVDVAANALRPGMVLVDPELLTPAVAIDHRMRAVRGSGEVRYLVADLDNGGWSEVGLRTMATVKVMVC